MTTEKLANTFLWASISVLSAMLADYLITIWVLHDFRAYTPLITFCIASIVALPTSYALVSSRINLRNASNALTVARDVALNADSTKSLFFANMSHELRTPLNAILGFSELLASSGFAERRVEYANIIHTSGQHLLALVNDLLDLSRIEAGKLELKFEFFEFRELIEECVTTILPRTAASGLRLIRSVEHDLPRVSGDRRALKQIVLNLLTNAIKFTKPGGAMEVFANLTPSHELCFGVNDSGIGISEEDQRHVFERFGQGRHDIVTTEKGAGLGLPIVKGLAQAHGGHVSLVSRLGQGTRVSVFLPSERLSPSGRSETAKHPDGLPAAHQFDQVDSSTQSTSVGNDCGSPNLGPATSPAESRAISMTGLATPIYDPAGRPLPAPSI